MAFPERRSRPFKRETPLFPVRSPFTIPATPFRYLQMWSNVIWILGKKQKLWQSKEIRLVTKYNEIQLRYSALRHKNKVEQRSLPCMHVVQRQHKYLIWCSCTGRWVQPVSSNSWRPEALTTLTTPGVCIPEGIESKLTLPACACHTIPLIANICSSHACSTLLKCSVSLPHFKWAELQRSVAPAQLKVLFP